MRIALDTGGTFTDCVFLRRGRLEILKVPSTPSNPALAISSALESILDAAQGAVRARQRRAPNTATSRGAYLLSNDSLDLLCGTTVGTNALLERRGGRVALVTTAGFEDVIEIGRQARPRLYDFFVQRPEPLVPHARRFGLAERLAYDGCVLVRPSRKEFARVTRAVARAKPDAVAVCLLFSFANPAHERALARELRRASHLVSVSHEILPEFREYERTATTVINAYLMPVMSRYLADIAANATRVVGAQHAVPLPSGRRLRNKALVRVRIMQSNGGIVAASSASREPVRTILSGPAGGILGAQYVSELAGFPRVITFDMGGTSTDVALLDGAPQTTNESTVADLPVAVPMLDIHTVGAGGGSIARFDRAGALRVGPESAGADPGPICYGRGELPTVTDAHLLLGHLAPEGLLGGSFRLDEVRTRRLMDTARRKAPPSARIGALEAFASGILAVANSTMEKAIRVTSVERGYDPRDYTLVAFGGAGALHAADLAANLGIPRVLVPKFPGALSALGILRADVIRDFSLTIHHAVSHGPAVAGRTLEPHFRQLGRHASAEMRAEGFSPAQIRFTRLLDVRYAGQAYELTVNALGNFLAAFHSAHEQRYGYSDPARPVEIVNLRLRATGRTPKPSLPRHKLGRPDARPALITTRRAFFSARPVPTSFYDRSLLRAGMSLRGPAVITEYSATTLVPPLWLAHLDAHENIVLERTHKGRELS